MFQLSKGGRAGCRGPTWIWDAVRRRRTFQTSFNTAGRADSEEPSTRNTTNGLCSWRPGRVAASLTEGRPSHRPEGQRCGRPGVALGRRGRRPLSTAGRRIADGVSFHRGPTSDGRRVRALRASRSLCSSRWLRRPSSHKCGVTISLGPFGKAAPMSTCTNVGRGEPWGRRRPWARRNP